MKLRVLHIEDSLRDSELIGARLEAEGLECHLERVDTRAAMLQAVEQNIYDIILCDFTIPSYNGMSALQDVRKIDPGIPFIFVSGTIGEVRVIEALKLGATDYVLKTDLTRLVPSVRRALREKEDHAKRESAEAQLKLQTSYFRQLFENSPAGIVMLDTNDHVVDVNRAFTQIFQYTLDETRGCSLNDFIVPKERIEEALSWSSRPLSGEAVQGETVRRRKDGEIVHVSVIAYPITLEGKIVGVYAIYLDETARKELEENLRQSQKLESVGALASGIAHDFNNILGIILGHASLLGKFLADREKFEKSVDIIDKAVNRGAGIVRQLLMFARKSDVNFGPADVNEIINETLKLLTETFPKVITLFTDLHDDLPTVVADVNQLHQVLLNLCVNARDAMPPQGGTILIKTEIVERKSIPSKFSNVIASRYVLITVTDTGKGMDEKTREHLFEPFFTTKQPGKGTGLGLSTVYGIVGSMQGLIDVESTVGRGTSFHIYLPVVDHGTPGFDLREEVSGETPRGSETILVVEDEETLRELVKTFLENHGYRVITAIDGVDGVRKYREYHSEIGLVISDLGLPKLSGDALYQETKQINPHIKMILASGFVDANFKSRMLASGVKDVIQKPYVPDRLLRKIRELLDEP